MKCKIFRNQADCAENSINSWLKEKQESEYFVVRHVTQTGNLKDGSWTLTTTIFYDEMKTVKFGF